jgi:hypothetical protein
MGRRSSWNVDKDQAVAGRSGSSWVEPLIPGELSAPVHPDKAGMAGAAAALEARDRLTRRAHGGYSSPCASFASQSHSSQLAIRLS